MRLVCQPYRGAPATLGARKARTLGAQVKMFYDGNYVKTFPARQRLCGPVFAARRRRAGGRPGRAGACPGRLHARTACRHCGHLGIAPAGAAQQRAGVRVCDQQRRHRPLGREHGARSPAPGAEPAGGVYRRAGVCDQHPRFLFAAGQQAAGAGRRPQCLFTAVFRRLLGSAGRGAGRRRAHRGDQRPRRHHLGHQCRQRRHQYHYAQRRRYPGLAGAGPRRQSLCRRGAASWQAPCQWRLRARVRQAR